MGENEKKEREEKDVSFSFVLYSGGNRHKEKRREDDGILREEEEENDDEQKEERENHSVSFLLYDAKHTGEKNIKG